MSKDNRLSLSLGTHPKPNMSIVPSRPGSNSFWSSWHTVLPAHAHNVNGSLNTSFRLISCFPYYRVGWIEQTWQWSLLDAHPRNLITWGCFATSRLWEQVLSKLFPVVGPALRWWGLCLASVTLALQERFVMPFTQSRMRPIWQLTGWLA